MRLLIAYDDTKSSEAALNDLKRAGLPSGGAARIICAAEPPVLGAALATDARGATAAFHLNRARLDAMVRKAERIAQKGAKRLRRALPGWRVSAEGVLNSPPAAVLEYAARWHPHLIATGSRDRSTLGRWIFGSVSKDVVSNAGVSVRVGRVHAARRRTTGGLRLLVGVDGSPDALEAVRALEGRRWPRGTEFRFFTAIDSPHSILAGSLNLPADRAQRMIDWQGGAADWIEHSLPGFQARAAKKGWRLSYRVREGEPVKGLLAEARRWGADAVIVGARGAGRPHGFLMGSVSAAVAQQAGCSVEVVKTSRRPQRSLSRRARSLPEILASRPSPKSGPSRPPRRPPVLISSAATPAVVGYLDVGGASTGAGLKRI